MLLIWVEIEKFCQGGSGLGWPPTPAEQFSGTVETLPWFTTRPSSLSLPGLFSSLQCSCSSRSSQLKLPWPLTGQAVQQADCFFPSCCCCFKDCSPLELHMMDEGYFRLDVRAIRACAGFDCYTCLHQKHGGPILRALTLFFRLVEKLPVTHQKYLPGQRCVQTKWMKAQRGPDCDSGFKWFVNITPISGVFVFTMSQSLARAAG